MRVLPQSSLLRRVWVTLPVFAWLGSSLAEETLDQHWAFQSLASPAYGEHWARHWLDVARYSDAKGYVDGGEPRYPFAFTYRDHVIQALNADRPFDHFVRQQVAPDAFEASRVHPSMAGAGFLTVGSRPVATSNSPIFMGGWSTVSSHKAN